MRAARQPEQLQPVADWFAESHRQVELGKRTISEATGGSQVAYALPDDLESRGVVPPPRYEPVEGACFFCSKPAAEELRPVTIAFDGRKRTVMVCDDDFRRLTRGEAPQMRGQSQDGQFVPWYQVQGYQPQSGFAGGGFVWDMLALSAITNMINPFPAHRGTWGDSNSTDYGSTGWDHQQADPGFSTPDFQPTDLDLSGDFGVGDFGSSDVGGGDFGGGDFGGGDFGGGGDF